MDDVYKLIRVLDGGRELQIAASYEQESLIFSGKALSQRYPDFDFAVKEANGHFLWQGKGALTESAHKDKTE